MDDIPELYEAGLKNMLTPIDKTHPFYQPIPADVQRLINETARYVLSPQNQNADYTILWFITCREIMEKAFFTIVYLKDQLDSLAANPEDVSAATSVLTDLAHHTTDLQQLLHKVAVVPASRNAKRNLDSDLHLIHEQALAIATKLAQLEDASDNGRSAETLQADMRPHLDRCPPAIQHLLTWLNGVINQLTAMSNAT